MNIGRFDTEKNKLITIVFRTKLQYKKESQIMQIRELNIEIEGKNR